MGMGVLEDLLGNVGDTKAGCRKVCVLELFEGLGVELGFELIEDFGEFYRRVRGYSWVGRWGENKVNN